MKEEEAMVETKAFVVKLVNSMSWMGPEEANG
jgi:hypothetical protein